jgi:glutamate carboxypeptidase
LQNSGTIARNFIFNLLEENGKMRELIEKRYEKFLSDLETIVNIDSGSGYVPGLEAVCTFFQERFQQIGWRATRHSFDNGNVPCLEVLNEPAASNESAYDLLCIGHMDTVFGQGTVADWSFSRNDNRAYGPGICDMKGGLVTMLHTAEILQQTGVSKNISIAMAFNSDEEIGSRASRPWYEGLAQNSRCVFVFEPWRTTGERVLHRKGGGKFDVICRGKAAHAGASPEDGANAVIELAHQILAVKKLAQADLGSTVNVTVISGGTADNVIPDYAEAKVDVRITNEEEGRRIEDAFRALSRHVHTPGVRVETVGGINRPPMAPSETTEKIWEQIAALGESIGLDMALTHTGGCSDGNYTAALGIPTFDAMGVRGGSVHSQDEFIELDSIVPNLHLMCEIVTAFSDGRITG